MGELRRVKGHQPPSKAEARTAAFHPDTFEYNLQVGLTACILHPNPELEALSGCWGNRSRTQTLFYSDEVIEITEGLETTFRHLRSPSAARRLWSDLGFRTSMIFA